MKPSRLWVDVLLICAAIALGLALLIVSLGTPSAAAVGQNEPGQAAPSDSQAKTYQGMVTCTQCRAKHPAKLGRTATDCTIVCIRGGAGFALIDGEKVYRLSGDRNLLKKFAGQRAQITGSEKDSVITVSSIGALT